ncbi:OmpA family protein [Ideonella sp. DXS22W]|uniref:OmpA family protein n=1 Tax=Pseudaquabacterium inlustre TaxID=2984192 RepID=A0ABU9CLR3_9BURK
MALVLALAGCATPPGLPDTGAGLPPTATGVPGPAPVPVAPPAPPPPPPAAAVPPPKPAPPTAPAPAPVAEKLTMAGDLFFDSGRATLRADGATLLAQLAGQARTLQLEVVLAVGHADASERDAAGLARARAEAVRSRLMALGLDGARVVAEGRGATQPVADNRRPEGRAKNRRVELEVVGTRVHGRAPTASPSPRETPCPTQGMAEFPWPNPPQWTAADTLSRALLLGTDTQGAESMRDVAARLERAVRAAGFVNPKFLGIGCDGFAMVLDLEQVDDKGRRLPGDRAWEPPGASEDVSLAAWIRRLFYAPPGRYRQIVLVISDQPMQAPTGAPTADALRTITREAGRPLPARVGELPFTETHVVHALVYEFEKRSRSATATARTPPSRIEVRLHLQRAGLLGSLR